MSKGADHDGVVSASLSDVGRARSENQDACAEFRNDAGERLLIVADGMGGHRGGATASRLCVEAVGQAFAEGEGAPEERMRLGLERANEQVRTAASRDPELAGMGTTAVALLITPSGEAWLAWVGDSRAYRLRHGQMERLSEDHSVVGEWVRAGVITPEEAEVHPQRHELTRAIGAEGPVEVDTRKVDLRPGDRFLLCSDGLCGYLSEAEIAAVLGFEPPESAVHTLVKKVNEERNAPDNVTVQILMLLDRFGGAEATAPVTQEVVPTTPALVRRPLRIPPTGVALAIVVLALAAGAYYAVRVGGGGLPLVAGRGGESQTGSEAATTTNEEDSAAEERRRLIEARKRAEEERLRAADKLRQQREEGRRARQAEIESLLKLQAAKREPSHLPSVATGLDHLGTTAPAAKGKPAAAKTPAGVAGSSPEGPPGEVEWAVRGFITGWADALNTGNYELYESLGFSQPKSEFEQSYADRAGEPVLFELLGFDPWVSGFVSVRLLQTPPGEEAQELKVVLRETETGLRYAGTR